MYIYELLVKQFLAAMKDHRYLDLNKSLKHFYGYHSYSSTLKATFVSNVGGLCFYSHFQDTRPNTHLAA